MISATDVIILTAIRLGIEDIRRNQFLIDDIMCQFESDPYLKQSWGKQQIDRFKDFISKTKINVVMETRLPDTSKLPAIIVKIGGGQEDPAKQGLGDSTHFEDVAPEAALGNYTSPLIILGPVTPESFDSTTGEITFADGVDLSGVFAGQFVYDEINRQHYEIQLILDDHTILIDSGLSPNLQNMTIRPTKNAVRHTKKSIWFYENYTLTCMSTEPNELMFLYSLVLYILGRYKKNLFEARNFEIATYSYTEIYPPNPGDDTNLLFARDVNLRGRVEHSFIESTDLLIEGVSPKLLIDPDLDGDGEIAADKTPESLYEDQVSKQGWELEKDRENSE